MRINYSTFWALPDFLNVIGPHGYNSTAVFKYFCASRDDVITRIGLYERRLQSLPLFSEGLVSLSLALMLACGEVVSLALYSLCPQFVDGY